jgi:hypothetical protein
VVFGGPGVGAGGRFELESLDGSNGFTLNGTHIRGYAGEAVGRIGDMNGDGYDDVCVGAVWADPGGRHDAGQAYVVFGRPRAETPPCLALTALDGDNGFVLDGVAPDDNNGRSVGVAGDVNGDGFDDVAIGALHAAPHDLINAGEV